MQMGWMEAMSDENKRELMLSFAMVGERDISALLDTSRDSRVMGTA
jgi:hypothetical protein